MATSKPRTRKESGSKLSDFAGTGKEFLPGDVPTNRVIIQRMLLLREEKNAQGVDMRNYTSKEMARDMVALVVAQWRKANLSFAPPIIIGENALAMKIEALWKRCNNTAMGRGKAAERKQVEEILDKLFDIVKCNHHIFTCQEEGSGCPTSLPQCSKRVHITCTCPKEMKVPVEELEWLRSQRMRVGE